MNKLLAISRFAPAEPDARTAKEWNAAWDEKHPTIRQEKSKPSNVFDTTKEDQEIIDRFGSMAPLVVSMIAMRKMQEKTLKQEAYERYKTDEWPLVWAKRVMDVAEAFDSKTES